MVRRILVLGFAVAFVSVGAVQADLNSRRAMILHTEIRGRIQTIEAQVPLSNMFGYATAVRGLTQGRANYTMEPLAYRIMPQALAKGILEVSY